MTIRDEGVTLLRTVPRGVRISINGTYVDFHATSLLHIRDWLQEAIDEINQELEK